MKFRIVRNGPSISIKIGKALIEAGWYRGEEYGIEAHVASVYEDSVGLIYMQIAKAVLAVSVERR